MNTKAAEMTEAIQKMAVELLAKSPAGEGMCLIGGFRYRLLDASCRRSVDLDYHWPGDLDKKQAELVALFRKKLLPLIRDRLGYDGSVSAAAGPEADSAFVKTVEIAVWQADGPLGRVTVPLDITRILCTDKPVVRTVDGVVYLSASDADMVESKVVALFARAHLAERDLVDIFLFQDKFVPDSVRRVREKLLKAAVMEDAVSRALGKMAADRAVHVRNINGIVSGQLEPQAAAHIRKAGGAGMIFDQGMDLLEKRLELKTGG
ncbi:MAG: hypothetical protein V2A79_17135 [Planctomycetota bacterium]